VNVIRRHPLIAFVVLAYGLSWAWWIPMAIHGDHVGPGHLPTHFPGLLGPLLAAFIVKALVEGRAAVVALARSMMRWRVGVSWFAIALGSPFVLFGLTAGVCIFTGRPVPSVHDFGLFPGLPPMSAAAAFGLVLLINGFGEETGWRGFALPLLSRRHSPLAATLLLSAIWAGWHAPLFIIVEGYRGFGPGTLVGFAFGLASGAIVLTQIFNRSGGSVLAAALWHTSYNMVSSTSAVRGIYAATVTTVIIVWASVLVVAELMACRRGASILGFGAATRSSVVATTTPSRPGSRRGSRRA
jgi:membrane protease YdiL (CAAX protease family)